MLKYSQIKNISLVLLFFLLFTSCSYDYYYQSEVKIPDYGWDYKRAAIFETQISDTTQLFNLILALSNTDEYKFSNIWFFVKTTSPKGVERRDSLEYFIARNNGKWLGDKHDDMWTSKMYFKQAIRFSEQGKYKFEIWQGMREDTLKGISKIAFIMQKENKN